MQGIASRSSGWADAGHPRHAHGPHAARARAPDRRGPHLALAAAHGRRRPADRVARPPRPRSTPWLRRLDRLDVADVGPAAVARRRDGARHHPDRAQPRGRSTSGGCATSIGSTARGRRPTGRRASSTTTSSSARSTRCCALTSPTATPSTALTATSRMERISQHLGELGLVVTRRAAAALHQVPAGVQCCTATRSNGRRARRSLPRS